jgi:hypothetical protein
MKTTSRLHSTLVGTARLAAPAMAWEFPQTQPVVVV